MHHPFYWSRRCLMSEQRPVFHALTYKRTWNEAQKMWTIFISEAHLQPLSPFFRIAGWAEIAIVGSKSLEGGTHFCKDLWARTSFKMLWIITRVHSPFSFRLDIANDDKCHTHHTATSFSYPFGHPKLLQTLSFPRYTVTPRFFRFIHKFSTY